MKQATSILVKVSFKHVTFFQLKIYVKYNSYNFMRGRGTRLWPLSRQSYPKQFLTLSGNTNKSLLQETQARISDLDEIDNPIIICNEEHRFLVAEQMRQIKVKPKAIILEPYGRNTAPAITLCAFKALEFNEDSLLVVLSADHIIKDVETFRKSLKKRI